MDKVNKIKYPKTWYLPYSEKKGDNSDKILISDDIFLNKEVVVSVKLDGENTTLYNNYNHARSINSDNNSEDRRWIEQFRSMKIDNRISDDLRIVGENLFYKHTCHYKNLSNVFFIISIWKSNICLSWDDTSKLCNSLELDTVPVIYEDIYDKNKILQSFEDYKKSNESDIEGFVIRNRYEFTYDNFNRNIAKFVCKNFNIGSSHWRHSKKTINLINNNINPWELLK